MNNTFIIQMAVGTLIGLGAGYLGAFMVLRRMALVGDALSHVALPGIAAALMFQVNPFIGAFTALLIAIIGIWQLEKRTILSSETLVGIFFTISLALGLLLTPEPELLEALFGDISNIGIQDFWITLALSAVVLIVMRRITKGLLLSTISKDLSKAMGIKADRINLLFLILVATIVALGLKVTGTLLMGSLVIIPAAAARNIGISLRHYTWSASLFGALSALWGIVIAHHFSLPPGPIVVLVSGLIFAATLPFRE
jgi:zinc transport system permease protein